MINTMIRNISFSVNTAIERLTKPSWYTRGFEFLSTELAATFGKQKFKFCVSDAQKSAENMASYLLQKKENLRALAKWYCK